MNKNITQSEIERLTQQLAAQLSQNKATICTAESCTGGLLAKTLTDKAGSSSWFDRGFVTYSNQAKIDMLNVSSSTLDKYGAVSGEVAKEMVAGAVLKSGSKVACSVTGIAGPSGGTDLKPVGTVWFGFSVGNQLVVEDQLFEGDREQIRLSSLYYSLKRVFELLTKNEKVSDN